jgi:hypothetical protein
LPPGKDRRDSVYASGSPSLDTFQFKSSTARCKQKPLHWRLAYLQLVSQPRTTVRHIWDTSRIDVACRSKSTVLPTKRRTWLLWSNTPYSPMLHTALWAANLMEYWWHNNYNSREGTQAPIIVRMSYWSLLAALEFHVVPSNDDRPATTLIILSMLSIVWNRAEGSIGVHDDVELHFIHVCGWPAGPVQPGYQRLSKRICDGLVKSVIRQTFTEARRWRNTTTAERNQKVSYTYRTIWPTFHFQWCACSWIEAHVFWWRPFLSNKTTITAVFFHKFLGGRVSLWNQIGVTRHFREQASYALTTNPTTTYYFRRRLPLVPLFAFGFSICRNKYLSSPPAYAFSFGNIFLESFV